MQFVEKPRPAPEDYLGEQIVHERDSLRGQSTEVFGSERDYVWQSPKVGPVFFNRANDKAEMNCQTVKETPKRGDPFVGDCEMLLVAKSERFVQGNAQNSVETFEFVSGGAEKLVHFFRKPGKPILAHAA